MPAAVSIQSIHVGCELSIQYPDYVAVAMREVYNFWRMLTRGEGPSGTPDRLFRLVCLFGFFKWDDEQAVFHVVKDQFQAADVAAVAASGAWVFFGRRVVDLFLADGTAPRHTGAGFYRNLRRFQGLLQQLGERGFRVGDDKTLCGPSCLALLALQFGRFLVMCLPMIKGSLRRGIGPGWGQDSTAAQNAVSGSDRNPRSNGCATEMTPFNNT